MENEVAPSVLSEGSSIQRMTTTTLPSKVTYCHVSRHYHGELVLLWLNSLMAAQNVFAQSTQTYDELLKENDLRNPTYSIKSIKGNVN